MDETQYWLEMVVALLPEKRNEAGLLWKEADELLAIVVSAIKTKRASNSKIDPK